MVFPSPSRRRGQHRHERRQSVRGCASEHPGVKLGAERLDGHDHIHHPAQAHGRGRAAHGRVAGVADQDGVGAEELGVAGDELLESAGALLLGPLDHELQMDRHVIAERAKRGEVHEDVPLAVGRASPVPTPLHLGQLERRGPPGLVHERRLDVVVGVEQHRRGIGVRARPGPDHGLAAVGGPFEVDVGEAERLEVLEHPRRGTLALLGGELPGVGDGLDGDQLGQLLAGLGHELGDAVA